MVIDFDQHIYTLKAIKRAGSDFSNRADISIESISQNVIRVIFHSNKDKSLKHSTIEAEFRQLVSDHQVNLEVEEDFKAIRQIIIAQAFFPCDNLDKVVNELSHENKI